MTQAPLRIVLADDHAIVRAGLRTLIQGEPDMEIVGEAETGEDAVRLAAELEPDVMVLDISMPGAGGAVATEQIVRETPCVRVLVLTMHDDRAHLGRLLEAGASGYVLKRAASEDLVRAIRTVGAGDSYVDPRLAGAVLRSVKGRRGSLDAQPLSEREEEVLRRIAWGESNKLIARDLQISTRTVETYKARIADKLGLRTRPEFVRYAVRRGWLASE